MVPVTHLVSQTLARRGRGRPANAADSRAAGGLTPRSGLGVGGTDHPEPPLQHRAWQWT